MRSIRAALARPRNDSPVPQSSRRSGGGGGLSGGAAGKSRENNLKATASSGTLFAIVNALSTAVSSVEWKLYRLGPDGQSLPEDEREEVTVHPALDLIRRPNPYMTGNNLRERGQQHIDLTGEGWLVGVRKGGILLELWPVMPHRITPVPHPTKFLAGYVYTDPDGEKIPLKVEDVFAIQQPNPHDFYRGLGPLDAIAVDVEASEYAAAWNRNYFLNSAEPGGVIQVEQGLSDKQFEDLQRHWNDQHRGVNRAHRVAILEYGQWVTTSRTQRDMQFTELREVSRDVLMEAFRMSKVGLGITDDVNRASALASERQFAKLLTVPRLERWRSLYNDVLLPQFYRARAGEVLARADVEFDYCSPVAEDAEEVNANRESLARTAQTYIAAGFSAPSVAEALSLPDMQFGSGEESDPERDLLVQLVTGAPSLAPMILPMLGFDIGAGMPGQDQAAPASTETQANADPPVKPAQPENRIIHNAEDGAPERDLTGHQDAWTTALDRLLASYETVLAAWRAELRTQITDATTAEELARLAIDDTAQAVTLLAEQMARLAADSAQDVVAEAAEQGVTIPPVEPEEGALVAMATAAVVLLATAYALSASREAVRLHDAGETVGRNLASQVVTFLAEQTDRAQRDHLGGALSGAQNAGRIATYAGPADGGEAERSRPVGSIYADETLDENTCAPCRAINGRFICTTEDLGPAERLYTAAGGYVGCLGGIRCRGTVTGVWRPATTGGGS